MLCYAQKQNHFDAASFRPLKTKTVIYLRVEDAMADPSVLGSRRQQRMGQSCLCNHRKGIMVQKMPTYYCCPGRKKTTEMESGDYIRRSWAKGQQEGASPGRRGHTCTIKLTGSAGKKNTKEEKKEEILKEKEDKKNTDVVAA